MNTDKQPQTVWQFVNKIPDDDIKHGRLEVWYENANDYFYNGIVQQIKNVYLITPAELEAMKAEHERQLREAAEKAFRAGRSYQGMKEHYPNLTEYLDSHHPLPQPPKD